MAKKNMGKVKRYRRSFYSGRQKVLRAVAVVVAILALFGLGWLVGPALINFGTSTWYNLTSGAKEPEQGTSVPGADSQPADSQPGAGEGQPTPEPTATPQPQEDLTQGSWAFLSAEQVSEQQLASTVQSLVEQQVKYAVIPLKDNQGNVLYQSQVATAVPSVVAGAFDGAAVADALRQQGIVPVASLSVFRDAAAAYVDRTMAVKYQNTEALWLDAARESGGKPWLNPYADTAVQYISDLIGEAKQMGFEQFWLSEVRFPPVGGRNQAGYGATNGVTESQRLATAIDTWQKLADCWIAYPLQIASGANETLTGGPVSALGIQRLAVIAPETLTEEETAQLETAKAAAGEYLGVQNGTSFTVQAAGN